MTYLLYLLFGFGGRISRKWWWIGTLVLAAASIIGTLVISPDVLDYHRPGPHTPSWPDTIWQLALVIPGTALMVKRFNDRERPYWLGYAYGVLGAAVTLSPHLGLVITEHMRTPVMIVLVVLLIAYLFAFIDNGVLRGSFGPNRYGPDPLATRELVR
jgi:uncharacterized membrane protein YhaH (DUF805 family)